MPLYYGYYSQAARGKRKRDGRAAVPEQVFSRLQEDDSPAIRRRWSQLIKQVYADPLICPRYSGTMRVIAFINDEDVIGRILKHLGLAVELPQRAHSPPPPPPHDTLSYEPFFDDLSAPEQLELMQKIN